MKAGTILCLSKLQTMWQMWTLKTQTSDSLSPTMLKHFIDKKTSLEQIKQQK